MLAQARQINLLLVVVDKQRQRRGIFRHARVIIIAYCC